MTAPNARERILPRLIDEEIKESFINYSMSVIVSRALPDVRDGLKPVHRRVLYAMNELGLVPGRPYKKCATVVGDVLGKYHPHGDSSVYDALVRMAQDFSLRYLLVDPQGNFGSIDGDSAAAYRYTEARMTRLAVTMLADIDKNTVDFAPNFDDRLEEPRVLPAGAPNLLINGSSGIAVGMATNIPPHNLREVVDACVALIDNPALDGAALRQFVRGPDFPTGGYIYGRAGIADYQETGRGRIVMRARAVIEEKESSGKSQIVVTEVPYQVNKAKLVKDIADLVRDGKLTGISALRDESDRDGIRVVIELKRDAIPRVVLNQLYKHTAMQSTFGVIMLALVPDETGRLIPRVLTLRQVLQHYLDHRHEVIVRRTQFDLDKALEREHILEGLKIAVDNIDEVIALIRAAADTPTASAQLQTRFGLSERQAEAILNMRLAKLTGLERDKLEEELREVRTFIAELRSILESREKRMDIMKGELLAVRETFGDDRRTEIVGDEGEFTVEDLIAEEEMVVTISRLGYIKRTSVSLYRRQGRGGKGRIGADLKDGDFVEQMYVTSTHNYILIFTDDGRCYWLKVHELPQAGRATRGKPIVNLINVTPDTRIRSIVPVREFADDEYLLFCTRNGTVKKTALSQYSNVRANGVKAIKVEEGDTLIDVQVTNGSNDVILGTASGLSIRFHEQDVREMGRDTTGVKGITLADDDHVVGMVVIKRNEATLLVATERGLGKCTSLDDYRIQKRGGKGIITLKRTDRTGEVVALMEVSADEEIMLITRGGVAIRSSVKEVRVAGRNTQGVKLVSLDGTDIVTAVARMVADDEKDGEDAGGDEAGGEDAAGEGGTGELELS
jgi:DNA gyrase subunit A